MQVIGIAIKLASRGEIKLLKSTPVSRINGLVGDCRGKGGSKHLRQITLLSFHQWEKAMLELGAELDWTARRANILVEGYSFGPEDLGKKLLIGHGESAVWLEITGETTPCGRMDEVCLGLQSVLAKDWRGGVTCQVLSDGIIAMDDPVRIY